MQMAEMAKKAADFVYHKGPVMIVLGLYAGIFSSQLSHF